MKIVPSCGLIIRKEEVFDVSIVVDLLIVLIMLLCIYLGYRRGLIKVAFKILSFFIAIIVALALYKPISNAVINNTKIVDKIKSSIAANLREKYNVTPESENAQAQLDASDIQNLPSAISNYIGDYSAGIVNSTANNAIEGLAEKITITIINLAVLLIIFVVIQILLLFVRSLADLIAKIPVIKQFNKAGGFIYGLLKGLILIHVAFAIILLLSSIINMPNLIIAINDSFIGSIVYNNNFLIKTVFK